MDTATLQRMHPEWNIVDFEEAPNGGLWALGRDGGVFALDATGGTTGLTAPFYGAYTGHPEYGGPRSFQRIETNGRGGYQIVSTNQEIYGKGGEWGPAPVSQTQAPTTSTTNTQQATDATPAAAGPNLSGSAALHAVLDPLGLGSLADAGLAELAKPGANADYVTQVWLPQQQQFKDAFPEIAVAQTKATAAGPGAAPHIPTPAEIVAYRQTAQQMVDQGLLPAEFVTKDKVSQLINGGVSPSEFQNRVLNGYDQFLAADPYDQAAFLAYHPSTDISHAAASFLDPAMAISAVERAKTQAQIGGAALRSGYGPISLGQATSLEQAGLTGATAAAGLTNLALEKPLFQNLAGETDSITQDEQLATLTGNAPAIAEIERRRATRQAAFQGGGGAASGGGGRTGLG